ncbi:hypothetical protein Leryth_024961 [Lithospermum erythrorhizon]|nr:hypothetical protein Leryth_024961 [Lithospermum erythrorhizon]
MSAGVLICSSWTFLFWLMPKTPNTDYPINRFGVIESVQYIFHMTSTKNTVGIDLNFSLD